jgi:hypothetical protein
MPDSFWSRLLTFPSVQVDWTDELGCFDSFLRELAFFYIPVPTFNNYNPKKRSSNEPESAERKHGLSLSPIRNHNLSS